jgi:hypothetical protein
MSGGRVIEIEAVNRQAGTLCDSEGAVLDRSVEVGSRRHLDHDVTPAGATRRIWSAASVSW